MTLYVHHFPHRYNQFHIVTKATMTHELVLLGVMHYKYCSIQKIIEVKGIQLKHFFLVVN